jgi:tetratricopeptide (TPR) repeat protein
MEGLGFEKLVIQLYEERSRRGLAAFQVTRRIEGYFAARADSCRGYHRVESKQYELALDDFNEALRLRPDHRALLLLWKARALDRMGNVAEAIALLDDAIALYPDDASLYDARGGIYHQQGDLERALADLNVVARSQPDASHGYVRRAALLKQMRQIEAAEADRRVAETLSNSGNPAATPWARCETGHPSPSR